MATVTERDSRSREKKEIPTLAVKGRPHLPGGTKWEPRGFAAFQ